MGMFLNSNVPIASYKEIFKEPYFVDKSLLIDELIPALGTRNRYFCITRPRRFVKSVMSDMISAFFCKSADGSPIFDKLLIAESENYRQHLNSHDVISIDCSRMPESRSTYEDYIARIIKGLKEDLMREFPDLYLDMSQAVWDILLTVFQKTNRRFIFVIDEWDALFHMPDIPSDKHQAYLLFLKNLLKDQVYSELVYMTGILPIAKYSDGSELNMFVEYTMTVSRRFSTYFGFLDREVDRLYNPRSIVCALTNNQIGNYWTSSGSYDSVFGYIKNNISDIQDDIALLFSGESIAADIQEYAAVSLRLETKDEIYSAMVVYGLLTSRDGYVSIPNRELSFSFASMMKSGFYFLP